MYMRGHLGIRPWPIMLKFLPIMLLSTTQKITHYVHNVNKLIFF